MSQSQQQHAILLFANAHYNLGMCYLKGKGTKVSLSEAASAFKKASDHGHGLSMVRLASLLKDGVGIQQNMPQALSLYARAAGKEFDVPEAQVELARCYRYGLVVSQNPAKAFPLLHDAINRGSAEAYVCLGDFYREGFGTKKDSALAIQNYQKALDAGCNEAILRLADCYRVGDSIPKNPERAFNYYLRAANADITEAYYPLAHCYSKGYGTSRSLSDAFQWYQKAADYTTNYDAMFVVGQYFSSGAGNVEVNHETAVSYYEQATTGGHSAARVVLADCYIEGRGTAKNEPKAVELYKVASEEGEVAGYIGLAECYLDGRGVDQDQKKGKYLLEEATRNGSAFAQMIIASRYLCGIGLPQEYGVANSHYTKAAETGLMDAHVSLGRSHYHGLGTEINQGKAVDHYRRAADSGSADAAVSLGHCYKIGSGVEIDEAKAVEYYEIAANMGHHDGRLHLAICHLLGHGCDKNLILARDTFTKLSEEGNVVATRYLARMFFIGKGVPQDYNRAAVLYGKAAEKDDPESIRWLASCYRSGRGVPKDEKRAFCLYKSAAEKGNVDSLVDEALCYERGVGVEKNIRTAISTYETALSKGKTCVIRSLLYCYSQVFDDTDLVKREYDLLTKENFKGRRAVKKRLASMYLKGRGTSLDYSKAISILQELRLKGSSCYALQALSSCYLSGQGVEPDPKTALQFLHEAREKKCRRSTVLLSKCLIEGTSSEGDTKTGMRILEEACEKGSPEAAVIIGDFHYRGRVRIRGKTYKEIPKSYDRATKMYLEAGDNYKALFRLYQCYRNGLGVEKSREKAMEYLIKAMHQGSRKAQLAMCRHYEQRNHPVSRDLLQALKIYKNVTQKLRGRPRGRAQYKFALFLHTFGNQLQGNVDISAKRILHLLDEARRSNITHATNDLAVLTERGEGNEDNEDTTSTSKAFSLLMEAAEQGHVRAQSNIGICYEMGIGTCRDMIRANSFYEKAVKGNDNIAKNNLALCLIEKRQYERAVELLTAAVDGGDLYAMVNLGKLYERGEGIDKDARKAFNLYMRAAEKNHPEGCFNVASCYESEIGTRYNAQFAVEYYKKAATSGYVAAKNRLQIYDI